MKERGKDSGCVTLLIIAPFILLGAAVVVGGFFTAPDTLTEDGHSQRTLMIWGGSIFFLTGLGIGLLSLVVRAGGRVEELQRERIAATYREGAARIEKLEQGSHLDNEHQRSISLTLEIVLPGKAPYPAKWDGVVDSIFIGQLRPNEWLKVRVSPSDPQDFHIQWGEAAKVPSGAFSSDGGRP